MDFNHYFTNEELESVLQEWAKTYPNYLKLSQIGTSYKGVIIWLVTLTNQATGVDTEKPAVWLDGNIHSTELAGTTTVLHIIHTLLTSYGDCELTSQRLRYRATRLLDTCTFYAVPRINPDGAALAMAANPQYLRSGVRSYPYEEKTEGLHQQDIDGDGKILQMRIPDSNGAWKVSSLDPRLMERREPDEHGGTYYHLLPEGLLEDFDGYLIKVARPLSGLDFNRNFPSDWRPEAEQRGSGPYPASEPEIKAVIDFIVSHPNINIALTYHTYRGVILRPYSTHPDEDMDTNDLWVYQKMGERGLKLTRYNCVSVYHDFRYHPKELVTGAFDDWVYDCLGAFSFTIELWNPTERPGVKDVTLIEWYRNHPHEDDLKILQWFDEYVGAEAYTPWYQFQHPQLGLIELGGWNSLYTWRNPPHAFMGEEAARNTPFALALGDMLPHLDIHTLEVTPISDRTYKINLVVENTGFLPTYTSQQGKKQQAMRPVIVDLELPETVKLISGKRRTELGHLEGRSNKISMGGLGHAYYATNPTDNRARVEWVIQANTQTSINLSIKSDRAGVLRRQLAIT